MKLFFSALKSALAWALLLGVVFADDEPIWIRADPHPTDAALVSVGGMDFNPKRRGTGVVVWIDEERREPNGLPYRYGHIVSAKHVIQHCTGNICTVGKRIKVTFRGGRSSWASVIKSSRDHDVTLLAAWIYDEIPAIPLASEPPPIRSEVKFLGLGKLSDKPPSEKQMRRFKGFVSVMSDGRELWVDAPLVSGDSGGGVIYKGHLVGTTNGGLFQKNLTPEGAPVHWPAKAVGVYGIKDATKSIKIPAMPTSN